MRLIIVEKSLLCSIRNRIRFNLSDIGDSQLKVTSIRNKSHKDEMLLLIIIIMICASKNSKMPNTLSALMIVRNGINPNIATDNIINTIEIRCK